MLDSLNVKCTVSHYIGLTIFLDVHIFLHSPFPIYSPLLTYYVLICLVIDKSSIIERVCVSINKIQVALYILIKFR